MKGIRLVAGLVAALAIVAAFALVAGVLVNTPESVRGALDMRLLLPAFALGQKLQMPTQLSSFTFEALRQRAKPGAGGGAEANVDVLYDTQTYLAAGTTVALNFFAGAQADETLSNVSSANGLDDNTYFDVWRVFVDANRIPTATVADTAAGVVNDIATILHAARATLTFRMYDKPVGPFPLTFFGSSGSVEGMLGTGRAAAAGAVIQVGRMPDNGGWPINGTIRIPPLTKFRWTLNCIATAVAVDTPLRLTMLGVKYRTPA